MSTHFSRGAIFCDAIWSNVGGNAAITKFLIHCCYMAVFLRTEEAADADTVVADAIVDVVAVVARVGAEGNALCCCPFGDATVSSMSTTNPPSGNSLTGAMRWSR